MWFERRHEMKKIITVFLVVIFFLSLAAPSAFAGSKQRHRWQGVAIGLGAAILGHALINNSRSDSCPDRVVVTDRDDHWHGYSDHRRRGHWEIRKVWVDPIYERVWNPAHYDPYGEWISGRYITIEKEPGYWSHERVWVSRR